MTSSTATSADAIVVGAGLNGSWVAKELTSGGMKVALLDAGAVLPDSTFDIGQRQVDLFNPRYHLFRLKLMLKGDTDRALDRFLASQTSSLFLDRREEPYTTPSGSNFVWRRVRAVGGRGHLWGRVMLRMTDRELAMPGYEWPIRYADLAPFYGEVERLLEMGGAESTIADLPNGEYVRQRTLHPLEQQFCAAIARRWPERRAVVNHVAQYEPAPLSPMLNVANNTGNLTMYPNKVALSLTTDIGGKVTGVASICTNTGRMEYFHAPIIVLAASAFETVRILLNSRSDKFPNGVGNSNGLVGTRILDHVTASFFGQLPLHARDKDASYGHNPFKINAEPHGFFIPPFSYQESAKSGYRFGFGVQGTISSDTGLVYLGAFGEAVPSDSNLLRLDSEAKDRFGAPVASIHFSWSPEELAIWKDASLALSEMIQAFSSDSGIRVRHPLTKRIHDVFNKGRPPLPDSSHESGGARMGSRPDCSVVDRYNRVWEAPNVLVCDTACFPTLPYQNPTLTSMALALRASRRLLADS